MTEKNRREKLRREVRCIFSELSLAVIVSSFFLRQCSQLGYLSLGLAAPLGGTDTC